ncbi:ATP-binding protein ManX [Roseibacterium elongatum DSM 19469]|uniref:ATP-binding protein ManX n=1 Tax=Roseicyclus elongatus DSM 19469 TaxID=1294273 RepID=W8S164_9RHOB|nr:RNase adapter RapZ [Roseibacterium elongatum]AHM03897.1 ATP-binding protein ManX [Roseibacterium elongatum DSM 19469]
MTDPTDPEATPPTNPGGASVPVVLVTGPSGAGRSTAINTLEDLGYEAIDNLPLSLLPRLLEGGAPDRPMALGMDARNRDFSAERLLDALGRLKATPGVAVDLLFLDCDPHTLQRRYSETRRRHPLAPDADPFNGIVLERDLLGPVRGDASILIDTSGLTPHDLRKEITRLFAPDGTQSLAVTVLSFSYRRGVPTGADLVFDCRFLRNPHWDAGLRAADGRDAAVQTYIAEDARCAPFEAQVRQMLDLLLPAFRDEGKSHLTVAFGCTGGQHRSVAMAEKLYAHLAEAGWQVSKRHREVERRRLSASRRDMSEA